MGMMDRIEGRGVRAGVTWDPLDDRWYGPVAGPTYAGVTVSADTASQVAAVFACNSLILETVASLPCILYRRRADGGKERATDHRWYRPVRMQPNVWQTSMDFFGYGQGHLGLRGTVVAEIRNGRIPQLIPLHPATVQVEQLDNGRCRVQHRPPNGRHRTLLQDEVLIVRDTSTDGVTGQARATLARQAIAVAVAGEQMVGSWLRNDATGRVVITKPGQVPDAKTRAEYRAMLRENYAGASKKGETMVMYGDATVTELGAHDDAAFIIDPRKFQVSDIARFWRVPGFMIGLEEKTSSWGTGIEQMKQGFVDFTIRPWLVRWEQAMARDLLSEDEQEEYFFEFLLDGLLRGDILSTVQALAIERQNGAINADEWRIIRNRNPRTDGGGKTFQETPTGAAPNASEGKSAPKRVPVEDDDDEEEEAAIVPAAIMADAAARIVGEQVREVGKRATKAQEDTLRFATWVRTFFHEQRACSARVLTVLAEAYDYPVTVVEQATDRIESSAVMAIFTGVPEGWLAQRAAEVEGIITEAFARSAMRRAA